MIEESSSQNSIVGEYGRVKERRKKEDGRLTGDMQALTTPLLLLLFFYPGT